MLTGATSYASPDREYPITFSAQKTAGSYLRFKYSQTGSGVRGNDLLFQVHKYLILLLTDVEKHVFVLDLDDIDRVILNTGVQYNYIFITW